MFIKNYNLGYFKEFDINVEGTIYLSEKEWGKIQEFLLTENSKIKVPTKKLLFLISRKIERKKEFIVYLEKLSTKKIVYKFKLYDYFPNKNYIIKIKCKY